MRKPIALLFTAALVLGLAGMASAQYPGDAVTTTYTWTLVESAGAALRWPNQAGSPNEFEANGGLLGRVLSTADEAANACEMAPSSGCSATTPPTFLLPAGTAEGPSGAGGGDECNRKVIACNLTTEVIPGAHAGHLPLADSIGEYSYLVIHTAAQGTTAAGKGIGFFAGSFVQTADPYTCNDCPPTGRGRDENVIYDTNAVCTAAGVPFACCSGAGTGNCPPVNAISNTLSQSTITTESVSLWLTQSTPPFGHAQVSLVAGGAGAGSSSGCGNGLAFQDLHTDLCVDALQPGTGNFTIPDQKVVYNVYSTDMGTMANFTNQGRCNPPECYIQNVIIPAAIAMDANAANVQVQVATSVLPADAPGTLANATVDSLIYAFTTQLLDIDGDGIEDRSDPCPNQDVTLFPPGSGTSCVDDLINGGSCAAGSVFCEDIFGGIGCIDEFLCNHKGDANQDCLTDSLDFGRVGGADLQTPNGMNPEPVGIPAFATITVGPSADP